MADGPVRARLCRARARCCRRRRIDRCEDRRGVLGRSDLRGRRGDRGGLNEQDRSDLRLVVAAGEGVFECRDHVGIGARRDARIQQHLEELALARLAFGRLAAGGHRGALALPCQDGLAPGGALSIDGGAVSRFDLRLRGIAGRACEECAECYWRAACVCRGVPSAGELRALGPGGARPGGCDAQESDACVRGCRRGEDDDRQRGERECAERGGEAAAIKQPRAAPHRGESARCFAR